MESGAADITVRFFASFKDIFKQKEAVVAADGAPTVGQVLERVCTTPERRRSIFSDAGVLHPDVLILVNGRNIRFLKDLATLLQSGDVLAVFPPVKGG